MEYSGICHWIVSDSKITFYIFQKLTMDLKGLLLSYKNKNFCKIYVLYTTSTIFPFEIKIRISVKIMFYTTSTFFDFEIRSGFRPDRPMYPFQYKMNYPLIDQPLP